MEDIMNSEKGQLVVIMLILVMIIGIVIPGLVYLTQHEAKWTVKEIKATRAFHLTEAGLDRGVFALNGELNGWNNAKNGIIPSGYTGTTEYSDIEGGKYKIKISSGPDSGEVTIAAIGKDAATAEMRGLKAIYSRPLAESVIDCDGNFMSFGNTIIHWGPVKARGNITLIGGFINRYFPRKYATGNIFPRNPPDTDGCEYWANAELPDLPEVALSTYMAMAKAYTPTPENGTTTPAIGSAGWQGGYYNGNVRFNTNFRDWESGLTVNGIAGSGGVPTYYITGNVDIMPNAFIKGNLIVMGNLNILGSGWANSDATNYKVLVPNNARKEYYHDNCDDNPYNHSSARTFWDNSGWVEGSTATITQIKFHGLIYCDGNILGAVSNQAIVGVVICDGNVDSVGGTSGIYYNGTVADNIVYTQQKFTRGSWLEFVPGSWSSPNW